MPKITSVDYNGKTVISVTTVNAHGQAFVKYVLACTQDEVPEEFYVSVEAKTLIQAIENWCSKKGFTLYSY